MGTLVLALGADADAAPMARLTVIHSVSVSGPDPTVTLDMPTDLIAEGGPVSTRRAGCWAWRSLAPTAKRRDPLRQHRAHA